jgi:hypothetical protein
MSSELNQDQPRCQKHNDEGENGQIGARPGDTEPLSRPEHSEGRQHHADAELH